MILGLLMMFELVLAFVLVNSWLVYNIIGTLTGKLILNAIKPGLGALWLCGREYPWQAASQID